MVALTITDAYIIANYSFNDYGLIDNGHTGINIKRLSVFSVEGVSYWDRGKKVKLANYGYDTIIGINYYI